MARIVGIFVRKGIEFSLSSEWLDMLYPLEIIQLKNFSARQPKGLRLHRRKKGLKWPRFLPKQNKFSVFISYTVVVPTRVLSQAYAKYICPTVHNFPQFRTLPLSSDLSLELPFQWRKAPSGSASIFNLIIRNKKFVFIRMLN